MFKWLSALVIFWKRKSGYKSVVFATDSSLPPVTVAHGVRAAYL